MVPGNGLDFNSPPPDVLRAFEEQTNKLLDDQQASTADYVTGVQGRSSPPLDPNLIASISTASGPRPELVAQLRKLAAAHQVSTIAHNDVQVVKKLGEGACGLVELAKWKNMDVVIKTSLGDNEIDEDKFAREIHMTLSLKSCIRVVRCCAIMLDPPALVLEHSKLGSLDKVLLAALNNEQWATKLVSWKMRLQMLCDIAAAILFMHTMEPSGLIHSDLRCANVLIDNHGGAQIADFGFAKHLSTSGHVPVSRLTGFQWLPPEFLKEGAQAMAAGDVYQFGAVMCEMLTGLPPFQGVPDVDLLGYLYRHSCPGRCKFDEARLEPILDGAYMLGELPPHEQLTKYKDLLLRCMDVAHEQRPTMKVVLEELECMHAAEGGA